MSVQQIGLPSASRLRFGPFEMDVAERSLKKANQVIPLGGRAYDILIAFLERPGEVIAKADLIAKAWPDVTVEEGSLRVHLSGLRKALGDGQFGNNYIANVQGQGYSFIAPVTRLSADRDRDSGSARGCPTYRPHWAAWSVAKILSVIFMVGSRPTSASLQLWVLAALARQRLLWQSDMRRWRISSARYFLLICQP